MRVKAIYAIVMCAMGILGSYDVFSTGERIRILVRWWFLWVVGSAVKEKEEIYAQSFGLLCGFFDLARVAFV